MKLIESEKTRINRKVKIKSCAKIFQGELGIATIVTNNLYFYVNLQIDGFETGLWFDFKDLEFL